MHLALVVAVVLSTWTIVLSASPGPSVSVNAPAPVWRADSLRPSDSWNTLTLDMRVSWRHVGASGEALGASSPATSYRLERSNRSGHWRTVVTVLSIDRAPIYAMDGAVMPRAPFAVARIEDEEDGTLARAYDARGVQISTSSTLLTAGPSRFYRTVGREWLSGFVASAGAKALRQQDCERQFGHGTRVGALDRFQRDEGTSSVEMFVEPATAVPVEVNTRTDGTLIARRTFAYAPAPDGAIVRAAIHSELVLSPKTGERAISDVAFSNVRLEQK